jgi:hypothetical protein
LGTVDRRARTRKESEGGRLESVDGTPFSNIAVAVGDLSQPIARYRIDD